MTSDEDPTVRCPSCGEYYAYDEDSFCRSCGANLVEWNAEEEDLLMLKPFRRAIPGLDVFPYVRNQTPVNKLNAEAVLAFVGAVVLHSIVFFWLGVALSG